MNAARTLAVVVCLALLMGAGLEAQPAFQRAQALYADLEFEQAIFSLESAALDESLTGEERATVFAWLGLCHLQVRRESEGRRFFEMAVRAHPAVALPNFAPPTTVAILEEVRTKVGAEPASASTTPPADPAPPSDVVSPSDETQPGEDATTTTPPDEVAPAPAAMP
jgi:hypothetical protein